MKSDEKEKGANVTKHKKVMSFSRKIKEFRSPLSVVVLAMLCASFNAFAQAESSARTELRELLPAQTIKREIVEGETHRYKFALQKDDFFQVRVEQLGIDLSLEILDASGNSLSSMDSPSGRRGAEVLSFIAPATSDYFLEVKSGEEPQKRKFPTPVKYDYAVQTAKTRTATAQDRRRVEIERLFIQAFDELSKAEYNLQAGEAGLAKLEEALRGWRELKDAYLTNLTAGQIAQFRDYIKKAKAEAEIADKKSRAETLFAEARRLYREENAEARSSSLPKFAAAEQLFREAGDKQNEAYCLSWIGDFYSVGGEKRKALDYYSRALLLRKESGKIDKETGSSLGEIGRTYVDLGEMEKALEFFNQSLAFQIETNNRSGEASSLQDLGKFYFETGDNQKALEYLDKSLKLYQSLRDRSSEASVIFDIGSVYDTLGDWAKAIQYYNQSMKQWVEDGDKHGEAVSLANIGLAFTQLGQKQKAIENYTKSLAIFKSIGDKNQQATVINNLGRVYNDLNEHQKALEFHNQSLALSKELENKGGIASSYNNIGLSYAGLGDHQKALDYLNQALPLRRAIGDKFGEAKTLHNIGKSFAAVGEKQKALEYLDQAVKLYQAVGNIGGEGDTLYEMMTVWNELGNRELAIFYGKQAVNKYQEMRRSFRDFDKETQQTFLKSVEKAYRRLADILISEGRLPEAQTVLGLIKEQEFTPISNVRSGGAADTVPYSKAETEIIGKIENLVKLARRQNDLQKIQKQKNSLSAAEQTELDTILADIETANKAFRDSLNALGKSADAESVKDQLANIQSERTLQRAMSRLSEELDQGVTAIYTVIGTEEAKDANGKPMPGKTRSKFGWAILVTPEGRKAYPIDVTNLEQLVFEFRDALSSATYDPQPLAEKLYTAVFRQPSERQKSTLEDDLEIYFADRKNRTVMWSLDGVLRYVPMAALHDGKKYLVEKYQSIVFTKESISLLGEKDSPDWQALGLGVSEEKTIDNVKFPALNGTKLELQNIVKMPPTKTGIFNGSIKLNGEFKKEDVMRLWREGKYPVIHIASHFSYNPLDQTASFLLVGDGKLTFADIQDKDNLFGTVDLLTLSACDTGVSGNGKEAEGFAYLAQSLGAKSVIASLWKVSDAGTPELMIRFYKLRAENPQMSKGEAFRRAQLEMLGAKETNAKTVSAANRSDLAGTGEQKTELPLFKKDDTKPFAHPHYWASFVLIGNWR